VQIRADIVTGTAAVHPTLSGVVVKPEELSGCPASSTAKPTSPTPTSQRRESVTIVPLETVRVLLVDDDEDDCLLISGMLADQDRVSFAVELRPTYDDALVAIAEQRHDVYLIDYRLGEKTGLQLVREAFASRPRAPVIMVTGQATYEIDLEASALGVTDFVVKQELSSVGLERSIRYAISFQKAERYALAVRGASDGIWDWNLATDRIYFSPRWQTIIGQSGQACEEQPVAWLGRVHPADMPKLQSAIATYLAGGSSHLQCEHRLRHADGSWRWMMVRGVAIRSAGGEPIRMAGSLSDITDRRVAQGQLRHDALHDTLTGLPNRRLFVNRVDHSLQRSGRDPSTACAGLFLDIDRFKLVNDSLSHAAGDTLLVAFAERVSAALRPGDTVARLGGDEFTVLLENVVDVDEATGVADRIQRSVAKVFEIHGNEVSVSASIGISLGTPGLSSDDLIRNADIAMYDAKRRGRACSSVFDETMRRGVIDRLTRETSLRRAVEGSLLRIYYQPIMELATGRIAGLEALARWPEDWPTVEPMEFIAIAEETGMIGALGAQVTCAALETLARWRQDGLVPEDVCMSVNLSGRQLDDPQLADHVSWALSAADLPPRALKLEITESTLIDKVERTQQLFSEVCETGVGLHLDDFGTGYSSLSALHNLPVETLKLDRSFVTTISDHGDGDDTIVCSAVALAHSLGLTVIAEGIERPDQLERLCELGCEYGQGYLFSPAVSAEDMGAWLKRWNPANVVGRAARSSA
jgi:diguanylate cyclase (GGDEF)-like protein/PAS domain S-box-containing protein